MINSKLVKRQISHLLYAFLFSLSFVHASGDESVEAPNFQLQGLSSPIALADHRGSVVYLDFWASWCGPCLKSFPWMEALQQSHRDQGLVVIAINLDAERELADAFLKDHPVSFQIGFDPEGITPLAYKVGGMPASFIIDGEGNIVSSHIGFNTGRTAYYEQAIEAALSKTPPKHDETSPLLESTL
ncbi:MAG: TlpA disulfide reductase family protein [Halioglobus sp.]